MTDYFPKVLVMAVNPISRVQSNGLMMRSFFQGWPKDRLAQVYFPFFHRFPPDGTVCERYLRVNPLGLVEEESGLASGGGVRGKPSRLVRGARSLARGPRFRTRIVDPLREVLAASPWAAEEVLRYSREFNPDVIYTLLGTMGVTRAAARVARELGCAIVPHFTDHWIETRFIGSPGESYLRRRLQFWLREVVDRAPVVLTMSGGMAEEYALRFGRESVFLTTLVDKDPYLRAGARSASGGSGFRLVYAGNLGLRRWSVLKLLGQALQTLRVEGMDATLEVYCSEEDRRLYHRELEIPGVVRMKQWVPPWELPELLTNADVLVHVESPDPTLLRYTRFSFSTKLSHYMMAGRCLLLIGPPEAGSMQEVDKMGGGLVVSDTAPGALEAAVRRLLTDRSLRRKLGERARRLALEHFEATRQRARFRTLLSRAAGRVQAPEPQSLPEAGSAADPPRSGDRTLAAPEVESPP